jgi:hypothetical protein
MGLRGRGHARLGRRRALITALVGVAALVFGAAVAFATTDHWYSGSLSASQGDASTAAHSIGYEEGDGTSGVLFCIQEEVGTAGLHNVNSDNSGNQFCATTGSVSHTFGGSCCFHADIGDWDSVGMTVTTATHYDY